ncbi:CHRD domain-containing protein [Egibacter rhizosphaerae]|uniref:CHRD domain-containing protein n=1 Tax=Egibacter rhizosphaerae TaxID=1670831 RepID=A0A411YDA2_9ACTN|nr:cell wall-binding repeat-containing protein [Egibacter rhizosphaerae]QBI19156.1 CHRD domain-containing protein [Egibacter rhizosphaerae]
MSTATFPRFGAVVLAFGAVLALLLVAAGLSTAAADEHFAPEEIRSEGADRYETAAQTALGAFEGEAADVDDVLLASGEDFPDALAASALAGTVEGPILLTRQASLPDATADAIEVLDPDTVHVLGGTAAVGEEVEDAVSALDVVTNRIAGADRFGTAADIASAIVSDELGGTVGEVGGSATALLADGRNFPDALAGGPGAYAGIHPILLTETDELPDDTVDALEGLEVEQVAILGGSAAIGDEVEAALAEEYDVVRLAGADRDETAAAVSGFFVDELGFDPANTGLATGVDDLGGADALASAPYLGEALAPLTLTGSLPRATADFLAEHAAEVSTLHVFGGTAAVSAETVEAARTAVSNPTYRIELSWINEPDPEAPEGETPDLFAGLPDGEGEAALTMNRAEGSIDFDITSNVDEFDDFDEGPGVHLHAGDLETSGPIMVGFADGDGLQTGGGAVSGTVTEDDFSDDAGDLTVDGIVADLDEYYVDLHSNGFPAGAVRGQLPFGGQDDIASRDATFEVELSADHEVVEDDDGVSFGVDSDAEGEATVTFRPGDGEVDFDIAVGLPDDDAFAEAPGAHLHEGRIAENGPIAFFFATGEELEAGDGEVSGTVAEDEFQDDFADLTVADILRDPSRFYVNVHSEAFPPGVARGQLPDGGADRIAELTASGDDDGGEDDNGDY